MNAWQVTVVSLIGTQLALALVLFLLYRSNKRLREARMWSLALLLVSVAWGINILRGLQLIPEAAGILLANAAYYFSGLQLSAGCRAFYAQAFPSRLLSILCVVFSVVLLCAYLFGAELWTRQSFFGCSMALILLFGLRTLIGRFSWDPAFLGLFLATIALVLGLLMYVPVVLISQTSPTVFFSSQALMLVYIIQPVSTIGIGLFGLLMLAQRMNRELEMASRRDYLTQVMNRRGFQEAAEQEFEKARRFGTLLTLAALDIDHFKRINDTLGHQAGDVVLRNFARTIQQEMRSIDLLCRWGGEEFIVLLPGTSRRGALYLMSRLRERLGNEPIVVQDKETIIRFSSGIVERSGKEAGIEDMVDRADALLYQAKENGRDRDQW